MEQAISLSVAMKDFFGLQPGQKVMDFAQELKALTPEDKAEIRAEFEKLGIKIKE
jgi:hypothetical protein